MDPSPRRKRFLIVSDSLGTPIHARGIFHYTANLVRALRRCGHDVSLLVEATPALRLPRREQARLAGLSPVASDGARLAAIYNYLWRPDAIGRAPARRGVRWLVARALGWSPQAVPLMSGLGLELLMRRTVVLPREIVANRPEQLEFVPAGLDHLRACSALVLSSAVYSRPGIGFASRVLGVGPLTVDARGFDVILVDTPAYLRFERTAGSEVVLVVHDLIPLADPTMSRPWRRAFANKVTESVANADSLVFVSEATRRRFCELFPSVSTARGATILYPSVADDIADGAAAGDRPSPRDYLVGIVSDEPRKNIENLLRAWTFLPPEIGLTIIGHVDRTRYGLPDADAPAARVRMPGYVDDDTKKQLLAGALGIVVPSFAEGFGIPLVEGAFFDKPVFCSDLPVFREVMGDHATYFDPYSPRAIAAAIWTYLDDPAAFRDRVAAAREHCRERFGLATLTDRVARRFGRAVETGPGA